VTHSGPEVLFKTCVAMKFVDDDDDDDDDGRLMLATLYPLHTFKSVVTILNKKNHNLVHELSEVQLQTAVVIQPVQLM